MAVVDTVSVTDTDGIEYEYRIHDSVTVEDVYEHILSYRVFELVVGEDRLNIAGVEDWFLEELRWRRM